MIAINILYTSQVWWFTPVILTQAEAEYCEFLPRLLLVGMKWEGCDGNENDTFCLRQLQYFYMDRKRN